MRLFFKGATVLGAYTVLMVGLTWPLIPRLTTHLVGGPGDSSLFVWNIWWFREALFVRHAWPFFTDSLLHPNGVSLALSPPTLLNTLPGSVLGLTLPLPAVFNVLIFGHFVGAAAVMHGLALRVARRITLLDRLERHAIAAFAALAYSMSPFHLAHLGHLNILTIWVLPFLAWSVLAAADKRNMWRFAGIGAALALCGLADPYHLVSGLLLVSFMWMIPGTGAPHWPCWSHLLALAGAFLVVLSPLVIPVLLYGTGGIAEVGQTGGANHFVADLFSYLLPSPLHPIWGDTTRPIYDRFAGNLSENIVFPTYTVVALAWVGWWRNAGARSWGLIAGAFVVLTLGPYLHVLGRSSLLFEDASVTALRLPLPKLLFDQVPVLAAFRAAGRFAAAGQLALALSGMIGLIVLVRDRGSNETPRPLATTAWSMFGRRWPASGACIAAALALLLIETWAAPFPTREVNVPQAYRSLVEEVARTGRRGVLLEIPVTHRHDTIYQLYQSFHGLPLLGGRLARGPQDSYDHLTRDPFLARLRDPSPLAARDATVSLDGLEQLNVQYVIVHPEFDPRAVAIVRLLEREFEPISTADDGPWLLRRRNATESISARQDGS